MRPAPGTRLGPYEIIAPLGEGGMGEVYRARDTRLDRTVALKVLPSHLADDPVARARLDREARAIAGLSHPNVCALFDVGHYQGRDFLVMELLEGQTLQEQLRWGPLEPGQFLEYAIPLADAVDAAHTRGVIHRDLKPANIFLTSRGVPKILDFGLAKAMDRADDITRQGDAGLTSQGTTIGTVAFMSPEQLRGEPLDARTDLFSLGLVFYEMATGQRAFGGATSAVIAAGILGQEPAPPRTLRPDLPPRIEDAILKAIAKDRDARWQSAAALRDELTRARLEATGRDRAAVTSSLPTATAPVATVKTPAQAPPASEASRLASRGPHRGLLLAGIGMLLIALAVAGGAYWSGHQTADPPAPPSTAAPPPPAASLPAEPPAAPSAVTEMPPATPPPAPSSAAGTAVGPPPAQERTGAGATPPVAVGRAGSPMKPPGAGRGGRGRGMLLGQAASSLEATLRSLPPQPYNIGFLAGSLPAREMAFQLQSILDLGGWKCSGVTPQRDVQAAFGIFVPRATQAGKAVIDWATRGGLEPDFRIVPRLTEIHIVVGPPK